MSDLREALARAICASCDEIPDHSGDCQGNQYRWQDYLPCADAALAVMSRSPRWPDEWVLWEGGACPVDGETVVKVRGRNGSFCTKKAKLFNWKHKGFSLDVFAFPYDIVAYCVVKEDLATKGVRTPTIDQEFMRVTYLDDEATKQAVFDRVMAYFTKHQAFDGESIHQRDSTTIDAPCVLAYIADNIIRFQVEYKK